MMIKIAGLIALCAAATLEPASACKIPPPPPQLKGESTAAYDARLVRLYREREMTRAQARIARGLADADLIFIARDSIWQPPARPLPVRSKVRPSVRRPVGTQVARPHWRPVPPPPAPKTRIFLSDPSYFAPIGWFHGTPMRARFKVGRSKTSCGLRGLGDTSHSQPGDLYLFFARKGPVSEATLIDAIALDSIDHPALNAFVAKHRKAPPPPR